MIVSTGIFTILYVPVSTYPSADAFIILMAQTPYVLPYVSCATFFTYEVDPAKNGLRLGQAVRGEGSASGVCVIGLRIVEVYSLPLPKHFYTQTSGSYRTGTRP
jgi:hypothetical protein